MAMSPGARDGSGRTKVPLGALRRLASGRALDGSANAAEARVEHCDLCGVGLPADHRHLLDRASGALNCACQACALLFEREGAGGGGYALVPRRVLVLDDFRMTDEQWDDLMIPVNMAFICRGTQAGRAVAYYPGPMGATASQLSLDHWETLVAANPVLNEMAPDVEALLINRVREAREHYLVPIDACYELAGLIRTRWKGLGGGQEVWQAIEEFFTALRAKARTLRRAPDAGPEL
jgi:uncharacterized protein DUF5947